jgi:hypothetical protein
MTMPVMEPNLDATVLQTWARAIDEGPFSSLCWGERIAFDNPDNLTLLGALAAWTERVRLVTTVIVPQLHDPVMLAKASVDLPGLSSRSDLLTQGPTVGVPTQRAGGFPSTRAAGDAEGRPGSVKGAVAAGRIRPVMPNGHRKCEPMQLVAADFSRREAGCLAEGVRTLPAWGCPQAKKHGERTE